MKKIKRKRPKPRLWTPFQLGKIPNFTVEQLIERFKLTKEEAHQEVLRMHKERIYLNNRYQVNVMDYDKMHHLSIKRRDKSPIHDWRDLQRIKNEIIGRKNEGVELYPSEERRVDTANQYHMWVIKDDTIKFGFGFDERRVEDGKEIEKTGAKQRKLEDEDKSDSS
jgi:hypothetical protein